jgi:hypothetical protein
MSEFQRGHVTRVTFEVEYPDGSTAKSEVKDPQDLEMIAFSGDHVSPEATDKFNVSPDDWKQNPTMLLRYSSKPEGGQAVQSGSRSHFLAFCSKDSHCDEEE